MDRLIKIVTNIQVLTVAVITAMFIAALFWFFSISPQDKYAEIQNEVQTLSESIRHQYNKKPDYWGLCNQSALSFVPKNMIRNNKIISKIGREYIVGQNENGDVVMPMQRNFMITLKDLNKKACEKIATLTIGKENDYTLQQIVINNSDAKVEFIWGGKNGLPVAQDTAIKICKNKNSISWIFE